MANALDKFYGAAPLWTGSIGSAGVSDAVTTTVPLDSATGLTNGAVYTVTVDRIDGSGNSTAAKKEVLTGLLSGTDLINCIRGEEGTAQAHAAGARVEVLFTAAQHNKQFAGLVTEHNADGTHKASMSLTTPKITTSINDSNGNEVIKTPATASAVNELTITNAATGNNVILSATGGDDNVGLDLKAKGTGTVRKPTSVIIQVAAGTTSLSTGDGKVYFTIPEELNGMNLVGFFARVITAGTTNDTLIQVNNVTDNVDMFSTRIGIPTAGVISEAGVIDTTKDDVATNDLLRIDIDQVSTTPPKGLVLRLRFALP